MDNIYNALVQLIGCFGFGCKPTCIADLINPIKTWKEQAKWVNDSFSGLLMRAGLGYFSLPIPFEQDKFPLITEMQRGLEQMAQLQLDESARSAVSFTHRINLG